MARLARVPANAAGTTGKTLDAGAHGVICPMIGRGAEAEALVRAAKYPPGGTRGNGPPEILAIYAPLLKKCAQVGVVAGVHVASPAYARRMLDMDFLWVSIGAMPPS